MPLLYVIGGVVSVGLLVYLFVALLKPVDARMRAFPGLLCRDRRAHVNRRREVELVLERVEEGLDVGQDCDAIGLQQDPDEAAAVRVERIAA